MCSHDSDKRNWPCLSSFFLPSSIFIPLLSATSKIQSSGIVWNWHFSSFINLFHFSTIMALQTFRNPYYLSLFASYLKKCIHALWSATALVSSLLFMFQMDSTIQVLVFNSKMKESERQMCSTIQDDRNRFIDLTWCLLCEGW